MGTYTLKNGLVVYVHEHHYFPSRFVFSSAVTLKEAFAYAAELLTRSRGKLSVEGIKAVGYENTAFTLHLRVHAAA
jgi:hypothetical protein